MKLSAAVLLMSFFTAPVWPQSPTDPSPDRRQDAQLEARLKYARQMLSSLMNEPVELTPENLPFIQSAVFNAGGAVTAEEAPLPEGPAADTAASASTAGEDGSREAGSTKIDFNQLLSGPRSRFFRAFSLSLAGVDQPNNIITPSDGGEDPPVLQSFRNPDAELFKLDVSFQPEQFFQTTDELAEAFDLAAKHRGMIEYKKAAADQFTEELGSEKLRFFARVRRHDSVKRFLSAWSLGLAVSERPAISGNKEIPESTLSEDKHAFTYTITFDPDKLLTFPGKLATAYKALDSYSSFTRKKSGVKTAASTESHSIRRLRDLSGIRIHGRWLAALLPTLKLESVDQFDFIASGGNFLSSSLLEESLETVTLTWDLGKSLDTAKHRRAAVSAIAIHEKLAKRDQTFDKQLEIVLPRTPSLRVGELLYLELEAKNGIGSVKWSLFGGDVDSDITLTKDGLLHGYVSHPGTLALSIQAEDEWQRAARAELKVEVLEALPSAARLDLFQRYVALATSPEILLDDRWFLQLTVNWELVLRELGRVSPGPQP